MGVKEQLQLNNQQLEEHRDFIPTMPTSDEARNGQYTWHKYEVLEGKKGKSIGFVVDDSEMAYPMDGIHTDGFYYILYGIPIKIVTWADGSDEDIITMIESADKGLIKLSDYWAVGQERKVMLSAMVGIDGSAKHEKQEVTLVLMNAGGKELSTAVESGRTECSFIVGMKNCLVESDFLNDSTGNQGGWNECDRRTWCNSVFKNSIPLTILPIFKTFKNLTSSGGSSGSTLTESIDTFALPSEKECRGVNNNSLAGEGAQFEWYATAANRKKLYGEDGSAAAYWLRSPLKSDSSDFCSISTTGGSSSGAPTSQSRGISPFGCI